MNQRIKNKILLSGGGTGGSVTPLLAIIDDLKINSAPGDYNFLWVGTKNGIEEAMVKKEGIQFRSIKSGKFRRYFDFKNFIDPFLVLIGFFQSIIIIIKWRPDLIMSAGSFVSVPVAWAGWLLRIPVITHQMDIRPGLANKLMRFFSKIITVTFEKSILDYGKKARFVGSPVRKELRIRNYESGKSSIFLNAKKDLPVILVVGGGTGSEAINEVIINSIGQLSEFCQIIHVTGKQRGINTKINNNRYKHFDFLNSEQIAEALALADLVISRCGIGFLSELSYLAKPSILIPMPGTHQEENAAIFKAAKAAIVIEQKDLTIQLLVIMVKTIIEDKPLKTDLARNINKVMKKNANEEMIKIINEILK